MTRLLLLTCLLAIAAPAQPPRGLDWRHIQSGNFEIVFPRGLEADANRAASDLETFLGPMSDSLGARRKRVTVILENQSPNRGIGGFVNLFPVRSVWYLPPPQFTFGANNWLTLLAAHEGRHLIQFRALDRSFTRGVSTLFGSGGLSTLTGWSLPGWWLEGDAIVAEAGFTAGGQARSPGFHRLMRANVLAGRRFSYMKAMHGSYNDVLPDYYELGSHMVSRVNRTTGAAAWSGIVRRWAGQSWNPFAFSRAMKKETGRGAAQTYADTISELSELWRAPSAPPAAAKHLWTSYYHPVYEPGGAILANKTGLADLPALVRIDAPGREETLFHYAPRDVTRISIAKGRMVWSEYVPDARWNRGYSEIVIRDLATGATRRLTHQGKFDSPALSPDGLRIAAVELTPEGICRLAILSAQDGDVIARLPNPRNDLLFTPAWSADGRMLAFARQTASGTKALATVDAESGATADLIDPSREDLTDPAFAGDYVLHGSSRDGIENIYAVHRETRARYQVTASRLGANYPCVSPDGSRLLYSDYGVDGYTIAQMPLDAASWRQAETVPFAGIGYHETGARDYTAGEQPMEYQASPYHPLRRPVNIHSWGVTSPPPEIGFGVTSTDKMGLVDLNASLKYDTNERTTGYDLSGSFRALYAVLEGGTSRMNREVRYADYTAKWTESTARAGFHIPLNLSRGIYHTSLTVGSGLERRRLGAGGLTPLNYWLGFDRSRWYAARDVAPAWGQKFYAAYQHAPGNGEYYGNLLTVAGTLFVPGPVRHHSIQLEGGNERRHGGNYYFSSRMLFPRGYDSVAGNTLWKASANYALPLLYPDLAVGPIAYLKRVTGNFFFDYGRTAERLYRSAGAEAHFEIHAFSAGRALQVGVRYAWRIDGGGSRVEPFVTLGW